jgi:uncharacterized glyoxalase superfamily protein PhnB
MSTDGKIIAPTLTPSLVYDDACQGIRWLVDVLGFREASRYEDPDGGIAFAELVWRTGVVFVSGRPPSTTRGRRVGLPRSRLPPKTVRSSTAFTSGQLRPVHDARTPTFPDGSHQFDVRDPEGNLWTVGTFQPRIPVSGGAA